MNRLVYQILTTMVAAPAAAWVAVHPRHRPLLGRFAPTVPELGAEPVWVHACSVGELGVAQALIESLAAKHPQLPLLLTVSTRTGRELAMARLPQVPQTWFPVDQHVIVGKFLRRVRPRLLVLIETELWPNIIHEAANGNVPVVIVNGRISSRHFPRYRRMGSLGRTMFESLSLVLAQNGQYAERYIELGAAAQRVRVTGNIKFDGVAVEVDAQQLAELRALWPVPINAPVLVAGSTRPGDEALMARVWETLRSEFPDLRLVIAPRHVNRAAEAAACFSSSPAFRSKLPEQSDSHVLIVDTLGELTAWYALATAAVVGGSFFAGVNGHNPIEAAALGIPTVFGPYMANFQDAADALTNGGGAIQIDSAEALAETLGSLLRDEAYRARVGESGRIVVAQQRGALEKTLTELAPYL